MVAQMAKAVGARAITTVGSAEKVALVKSWGIDLVLNYKTDDVPARVKEFTGGDGVDVWYETQREFDLPRTIDLMKKRGRIVLIAGRTTQATLPVGPFYVKRMSILGFSLFEATPDEQRQGGRGHRSLARGEKTARHDRQGVPVGGDRGGTPISRGEHHPQGGDAGRQDRPRAVIVCM